MQGELASMSVDLLVREAVELVSPGLTLSSSGIARPTSQSVTGDDWSASRRTEPLLEGSDRLADC